jgi:IMP cyclohydrolase
VLDGTLTGPTGPIYANYVPAEDLSKARGGSILRRIVISLAKEPLTFPQIARAVRKKETSVGFYLDQLLRFDAMEKDASGGYLLVYRVIAESISASLQ